MKVIKDNNGVPNIGVDNNVTNAAFAESNKNEDLVEKANGYKDEKSVIYDHIKNSYKKGSKQDPMKMGDGTGYDHEALKEAYKAGYNLAVKESEKMRPYIEPISPKRPDSNLRPYKSPVLDTMKRETNKTFKPYPQKSSKPFNYDEIKDKTIGELKDMKVIDENLTLKSLKEKLGTWASPESRLARQDIEDRWREQRKARRLSPRDFDNIRKNTPGGSWRNIFAPRNEFTEPSDLASDRDIENRAELLREALDDSQYNEGMAALDILRDIASEVSVDIRPDFDLCLESLEEILNNTK